MGLSQTSAVFVLLFVTFLWGSWFQAVKHTGNYPIYVFLNWMYLFSVVIVWVAFIEVNEKIDAAMNYLPKEAERPKVIKASATDIPVFYLNLTLKNDSAYGATEQHSFLELCEFAESVIKRRIEQLEEVAMVDVTGILERQVQIVPDKDKLAMMGLSIGDIESALSSNNVEPGSMTVRDGYYEYNIKFSTLLRTAEDVENIYLRKDDRIVQLKDFCKVSVVPVKEKGVSLSNGKRAVSLAVIKQADENMDKMKQALVGTMTYFQLVYPETYSGFET